MTHTRGDLLRALSKKLIQLSGNDMINKRLSGKGTGGLFNVCDEIPQFVLNRLMAGKKFKIVGMMEPDDYLMDEFRAGLFRSKLVLITPFKIFSFYKEDLRVWEFLLQCIHLREGNQIVRHSQYA